MLREGATGVCRFGDTGTGRQHMRLTAMLSAVVASCIIPVAAIAAVPPAPDCLFEAAERHQVNPWVLRAIAWQETKNKPHTVVRNTNGSVDVGIGGINSVHFTELAKYGIEPGHLLDACTNLHVAAWHLRRQMNRFGNTWQAVGAYHSKTPSLNLRYANTIRGILKGWGVVAE